MILSRIGFAFLLLTTSQLALAEETSTESLRKAVERFSQLSEGVDLTARMRVTNVLNASKPSGLVNLQTGHKEQPVYEYTIEGTEKIAGSNHETSLRMKVNEGAKEALYDIPSSELETYSDGRDVVIIDKNTSKPLLAHKGHETGFLSIRETPFQFIAGSDSASRPLDEVVKSLESAVPYGLCWVRQPTTTGTVIGAYGPCESRTPLFLFYFDSAGRLTELLQFGSTEGELVTPFRKTLSYSADSPIPSCVEATFSGRSAGDSIRVMKVVVVDIINVRESSDLSFPVSAVGWLQSRGTREVLDVREQEHLDLAPTLKL